LVGIAAIRTRPARAQALDHVLAHGATKLRQTLEIAQRRQRASEASPAQPDVLLTQALEPSEQALGEHIVRFTRQLSLDSAVRCELPEQTCPGGPFRTMLDDQKGHLVSRSSFAHASRSPPNLQPPCRIPHLVSVPSPERALPRARRAWSLDGPAASNVSTSACRFFKSPNFTTLRASSARARGARDGHGANERRSLARESRKVPSLWIEV